MTKTFDPTPEQAAIVEAARTTKDNLLVAALAGAAKTSTLELIAKAVTGIPILCVAFNKKIAEEMTKRLPSHCIAKTMNSIGHSAWAGHTGKRLTLDTKKTAEIIRNLSLNQRERNELREVFGDVLRLAGRAKSFGYIPPNAAGDLGSPLVDRQQLQEILADDEYDDFAWGLLDEILRTSIKQAYNGLIDFDDQVYMSTLFGAQLPKFPLVLVDEAQDLSPLNHQMVSRLVTKRIIAVGDHYQSIYGFRGAVSDGLSVLRDRFAMRELTLSVSFRCPKEVVKLARSRAPHMKWPEWAIDGEIRNAAEYGTEIFPDSAAIICRNNAPLFSMGLRLLRQGRAINMKGFDISKRIVKVMEGFGPGSMPQAEAATACSRWRNAKLTEAKLKPDSIEDRFACMMVFIEQGETLSHAIGIAQALFAQEGPLELMSGHKSKGLEFDHVFHLDPWRVPSRFAEVGTEEYNQELNLLYVIQTRAKRTYTTINLDQFVED